MSVERIKVLLVDDQILFVQNLKYVIEGTADDIEIVGIAHNGLEAVRMAREHEPHIILMDVRMPKMDGVKATRMIHFNFPRIKVIMLTTFQDDDYVYFALKFGAVGFLSKNILTQDLLASVRAVYRGARLFSKDVADKFVGKEGTASELDKIIATLSAREKEVLELIMAKLNNKQIGVELNIAQQSVRNYVHSIYSAFRINDRMELIQKLEKEWSYLSE